MENQAPKIPTSMKTPSIRQETAQSPPIQKTNKPLIIGLVIVIFLLMCSTGYLAYQNYQLNQQISQAPSTQIPTPSPSIVDKTTLSESLSQFCIDGKITLDKLPFVLSQTLKEEYEIQNNMNCYVPDESYASIRIQAKEIDLGDIGRTVYFFHQGSKYFGQGDAFRSLNNYKPVTINGQNYWVNIMEPGPYGISTLGIWVQLITEKKDSTTGTIARSVVSKIYSNQEFLDLVIKHGEKQTDPTGPEYVVRGPDNPDKFKGELVELAIEQNTFLELAQNATSDLGGISF